MMVICPLCSGLLEFFQRCLDVFDVDVSRFLVLMECSTILMI